PPALAGATATRASDSASAVAGAVLDRRCIGGHGMRMDVTSCDVAGLYKPTFEVQTFPTSRHTWSRVAAACRCSGIRLRAATSERVPSACPRFDHESPRRNRLLERQVARRVEEVLSARGEHARGQAALLRNQVSPRRGGHLVLRDPARADGAGVGRANAGALRVQ